MKITALSGLVAAHVAMAGAHLPEGETFYAVQFPDRAVPIIDGDLGDWALVPGEYSIRSDRPFSPRQDLPQVGRGGHDPNDIEVWHRIGFNPNTDDPYFASAVFDDYHNTDREELDSVWLDDSWDVRVEPTGIWDFDAGANIELGDPGTQGTIYIFAVPPRAEIYQRVIHWFHSVGTPWMLDGAGHMDFGWTYQGDMLGGESTYSYELRINPLWSNAQAEEDIEWMDVEEGMVLHFNILIADIGNRSGPRVMEVV